MTSWEGANVVARIQKHNEQHPNEQRKERSLETVEATLNRLSKAYSAAMECVGALYRADASSSKAKAVPAVAVPAAFGTSSSSTVGNDEESVRKSLQQVGQAARSTFEQAILLDPLVVEHAPVLTRVFRKWATSGTVRGSGSERQDDDEQQNQQQSLRQQRWRVALHKRPLPPSLSSAGHKSTVSQLAYLSLVNYSDLLLAGCACSVSTGNSVDKSDGVTTTLDRGVVRQLKILSSAKRPCCCWNTNTNTTNPPTVAQDNEETDVVMDDQSQSSNKYLELEEDTVRLAVTALIDASALDGSDPTLWLKLACAARRLGRLQAASSADCDESYPATLLSYRRLEKHALERARTALSPSVPPNRTVMRAMEEWNEEEDALIVYPETLAADPEPQVLTLELPRYSWSVLGRMLLRACREGTAYSTDVMQIHHRNHLRRSIAGQTFASPAISLRLSRMLALPSSVLGRVCQYLDEPSIWRFEATCRALSVSLISARAALDHSVLVQRRETEDIHKKAEKQKEQELPVPDPSKETVTTQDDAVMGDDRERNSAQASRASKRVRSQIITSGKRAERSARRNSTEYCLLAATLGCTADDKAYREALEKVLDGDGLALREQQSKGDRHVPTSLRRGTSDKPPRYREEARERLSESALTSFVERWGSRNSPPLGVLVGFVAHVSLHLDDVFSSDPGGSMVLASCLLECFDIMTRRSRSSQILVPSWSAFGFTMPSEALHRPIDLFAIDVLHIELRFKRCEREEHIDTDFDADGNVVSSMVPWLLSKIEELDVTLQASSDEKTWMSLKARCHWLAAGFYLWMGRRCQNVSESREAEIAGLGYIEETLGCLSLPESCPIASVQTPHLGSPGRIGIHWRELSAESITTFRDEIQASSVILLAQEQFLEASSKIDGTTGDEVLREEDGDALFAIGTALLERYLTPVDSPDAKHVELIDDFLSVYGDDLLSRPLVSASDSFSRSFDVLVPTGRVDTQHLLSLSSPCILTILVTCLNMKAEKRSDVVRLLARLAITVTGLHGIFRDNLEQPRREMFETDVSTNDSDSDGSLDSDDEEGQSDGRSMRRVKILKLRQYARLVQLLNEKVRLILKDQMTDAERSMFVQSDDYRRMISASLGFASDSFSKSLDRKMVRTADDDTEDLEVFLSTKILFETACDCAGNETVEKDLVRLYFKGLVRIVTQQRSVLSSLLQSTVGPEGRSLRVQLRKKRSEFTAAACCELGLLLSRNLVRADAGVIERSYLFQGSHSGDGELSGDLVILSESLLWFWGVVSGSEATSARAMADSTTGRKTDSVLDKPSRERLQVPIAAAIVGLCGSAVSTVLHEHGPDSAQGLKSGSDAGDQICLTEFYDSDTSAMDWLVDTGEGGDVAGKKREELLRVISQVVYCVKHVYESISEDEALSYPHYCGYLTTHGPLLPLIISRVLNRFADRLLVEFVNDDAEKEAETNLWSDYSFGTRTTGHQLDSTLYKAYKSLHGFTLINVSDGRESSGGGPAASDKSKPRSLPEHPAAAASLYRCIMRAYSQGRKSPPKAALETVLLSFPPEEESEKAQKVRKYLFTADDEHFKLKDLVSLVTKDSSWETRFLEMQDWDWENMQNENDNKANEDEQMIVRKGIASLLAQGPLPTFQDSGSDNDARASTVHLEEEFSKKFHAIIDDVCYGNTGDCESWYKAAQCLISKADLIADRLGSSEGFVRSRNFYVPDRQSLPETSLNIAELISEQERDARLKSEGWVNCLGHDLSTYVRHHWSSFQSLQSCSAEVGIACKEMGADDENNNSDAFKAQVWTEIDELFTKNDFAGWQQAWGGLFVSSLRLMALRCMCLGVYVLYKRRERSAKESLLISEVTESLGVTLYSQLIGSQVYGYPLHAMTDLQKRELAEASLTCFESAIESSATSGEESDGGSMTWDLLFMIGKCHEKVANTYQRETFPPEPQSEGTRAIRKYERHMAKALQSYTASLSEAKVIEKEGGAMLEQNGGSAHGSAEVLYRLHASRLKCLIRAVDRREDEMNSAELEALRLTECSWFLQREETTRPTGVRDRVWSVLEDVVSALAQCRLDQPFFHRSVYRHAQALMWAPVLCDPVGERANGSLGMVPATRAFKLRGLNFSTNAAHSGVVVISSLFEKKRSQLCGVWVTSTSSSSTFQTINNSVRKYDSLRGKYVGAYIDSLRLCNRRNELETFFRWTSSCRRDLPSYFAASAQASGGPPQQSHARDCLLVKGRSLSSSHFLTTVKRMCNSAVAAVILHQLTSTEKPQDSKALEGHLKSAYACFLRLNCEPKDLSRGRSWKYHRTSTGVRDIVEVLTIAYLKVTKDQPVSGIRSDWSGDGQKSDVLQLALDKCKELFPTLLGTLKSRKRPANSKNKTDVSGPPAAGTKHPRDPSPGAKGTVKRSFEVKVPDGLAAGDTFLVSLRPHGVEKKIKLTVPEGTPATLRFVLQVPATSTDDAEPSQALKIS